MKAFVREVDKFRRERLCDEWREASLPLKRRPDTRSPEMIALDLRWNQNMRITREADAAAIHFWMKHGAFWLGLGMLAII
jgi:hypothetical protein